MSRCYEGMELKVFRGAAMLLGNGIEGFHGAAVLTGECHLRFPCCWATTNLVLPRSWWNAPQPMRRSPRAPPRAGRLSPSANDTWRGRGGAPSGDLREKDADKKQLLRINKDLKNRG